MIRNKAKTIAAFALAAMMAVSITPAMASPSFASEENTEATITDAEVMMEETEEMVEETEEIAEGPEENVSEESQQEEVSGEKTGEEGFMKAMASTSPSGADSLTAGQWKSGRFTYSYPTYGNNAINGTYMNNTFHYYKFRTGSKAGATYTVKAEYTKFTGYRSSDRDSYGIWVKLLDSNYNEVRFDSGTHTFAYTKMNLKLSEAGNLTYTHLKQNADYYVVVESDSGYNRNAIDYKVCYTTDASSTTQPGMAPIPSVTLDKATINSKDPSSVYVSGTVTIAKGQDIGLYDSTGKIMYNFQRVGYSNGKESFRIQVPARYLANGTNTFKVKSAPVKNTINGSNPKTLTVVIGSSQSSNNTGVTIYPVYHVTVGGSVYEVCQYNEIGGPAARLVKAKNSKSVAIPSMIKYKGVRYSVTGIQSNAFKNSKAKTVTVKTIKFTKASVRNSLKGSKVKKIKVKAGNKKLNKSIAKKYKGLFIKGNCGKKVKVK